MVQLWVFDAFVSSELAYVTSV